MHKYFAKPLFLGKKVVFLPECQSTNAEMMQHLDSTPEAEGFVIHTDHQTKGKGQRGNIWVSESGRNLLFSILLKPRFLSPKEGYLLNIMVGLGVVSALKSYQSTCELKWPNDIYTEDKKVGGILIEQQIDSTAIQSAIVGIGLNVNQSHFSQSEATSLMSLTGQSLDREILLEEIIFAIEKEYLMLKTGKKESLLQRYYKVMRWRGEEHIFKSDGLEFSGEIIGVDHSGRLVLKTNGVSKSFDIKQITFLY